MSSLTTCKTCFLWWISGKSLNPFTISFHLTEIKMGSSRLLSFLQVLHMGQAESVRTSRYLGSWEEQWEQIVSGEVRGGFGFKDIKLSFGWRARCGSMQARQRNSGGSQFKHL